jgi:predicted  nucleic acid-binding Zn-ribbon protein
MSAQVDQFCDKLKGRLDTIEGRIQSAKSQIAGLPDKGEKAVRKLLDNAHSNVESRKQRVDQAFANLKAQAEEKVAETKEEVARWKQQRDVRKLTSRADRAEAYATDAIDYAIATIEEAEEAVLEAVVARHDADAAQ